MRTYVRWQAVRLGAVALVVGIVLGLLAPRLFAAGSDRAEILQRHVVTNGETLWELASRYAGDEDPRRYVHEIKTVNGLERSAILPGQSLIIP